MTSASGPDLKKKIRCWVPRCLRSREGKYRRMFHGMEHVQDAHLLYLGGELE
jgi:hypothetical protein